MSETGETPGAGGDKVLPNGGGGGPGPGPGPAQTVVVRFTTLATAQLFTSAPFTVTGTAGSTPLRQVSGVSLTVDGAAVQVVSDAAGWTSWHAVITPATAGSHTLVATASSASLGLTATSSLQLTATPVLTCQNPMPSPGLITTATLSFAVSVAVGTTAFAVTAAGWQYQIAGGSWTQPGSVSQPSTGSWQLGITLPAVPVAAGGTSYPLLIRATTPQNQTATLALTVHAVDLTAPSPPALSVPAEVVAGTALTLTFQVSDRVTGMVFSGIPANGVSLRFDGQPYTVTQTVAGDPASWSATLPPATHAFHSLVLTVADAAGNAVTVTRSFSVALTSWTRLEPAPRDPTLMEGLRASVADPFWLLARQAAFGELTGQDAASPVSVRLRARASELTRLRPARAPGSANPATGPGELLPPGGGPLEMLAEAEAEPQPGGAARPLFAAQAGLHYLRLLARAPGAGNLSSYEQGLLGAYPIPPPTPAIRPGVPPPPAPGDPALLPYAGRVPDGARLHADLSAALRPPGGGAGALPASPALSGASAAVVTGVARAWLSWYDAVSGAELGPLDTWIPERSEYAFSVAAPGPRAETVLAAAELDTGQLDWLDFDLLASSKVTAASPSVSLGAVLADRPGGDTSIFFAGPPSPVIFRGMPNRSWWDFEDAAIDFGAITAPVESLTTSVIVEYAMCYGNDHFIIGVPLAVGSVLVVDSLVVTDTFGEMLAISPVAQIDSATGQFRLFEHAVPAQAGAGPVRDPVFVLFPTAGEVITGPAVEEVHFLRDEAAEVVWAIEQTALGPAGLPADRTADAAAHFQPLAPGTAGGSGPPTRSYVLRTDVETNWFPFLPAGAPSAAVLAMADVQPLDASSTPLPWGRILAPFAPVMVTGQPPAPGALLPLEQVTRAGAQVARGWRYARWIDGRQLSWVGRRVRPGRGPGASGLTFDLAR